MDRSNGSSALFNFGISSCLVQYAGIFVNERVVHIFGTQSQHPTAVEDMVTTYHRLRARTRSLGGTARHAISKWDMEPSEDANSKYEIRDLKQGLIW